MHQRAARAHTEPVDIGRFESGVVERGAHHARLERAQRQVDLTRRRNLVGRADDGDRTSQRMTHRASAPTNSARTPGWLTFIDGVRGSASTMRISAGTL